MWSDLLVLFSVGMVVDMRESMLAFDFRVFLDGLFLGRLEL